MKRLEIQEEESGRINRVVSECTNQKFIETVEYLMNFHTKEELETVGSVVKDLCRLKDIWCSEEREKSEE